MLRHYMKDLNIFDQWYLSWKYPMNWFKNIKIFFKSIKWGWQRATRGYSDYDVWDLDYFYTHLIANTLDYLGDHHVGVPMEFNITEDKDPDDWAMWLYDTADLLRQAAHYEDDYSFTPQYRAEEGERLRQEAFTRLLSKWTSLWD